MPHSQKRYRNQLSQHNYQQFSQSRTSGRAPILLSHLQQCDWSAFSFHYWAWKRRGDINVDHSAWTLWQIRLFYQKIDRIIGEIQIFRKNSNRCCQQIIVDMLAPKRNRWPPSPKLDDYQTSERLFRPNKRPIDRKHYPQAAKFRGQHFYKGLNQEQTKSFDWRVRPWGRKQPQKYLRP